MEDVELLVATVYLGFLRVRPVKIKEVVDDIMISSSSKKLALRR
jgi:hypothetical protein